MRPPSLVGARSPATCAQHPPLLSAPQSPLSSTASPAPQSLSSTRAMLQPQQPTAAPPASGANNAAPPPPPPASGGANNSPGLCSGKQALVAGECLAMRLWTATGTGACDAGPHAVRHLLARHEGALYALEGEAELTMQGATRKLAAGSAWVVPSGTPHSYRVTSAGPFRAVEATAPPTL